MKEPKIASNQLVKVSKSKLPNAGNGLFAKVKIPKSTVICTYGGRLIAATDAKYENPMYIVSFELGRGDKLIGDNELSDLGIYANAIHPDNPDLLQNSKFVMKSKKSFVDNNHKRRGVFNVMAMRDINKGEEIIVNYGEGYWATMKKWDTEPHPIKSEAVLKREARCINRELVKLSLREEKSKNKIK